MSATGAAARKSPEPDLPAEARDRRARPEVPLIARDAVTGFALAAASANIIMQLSRRPVGRGVAESKVDSGRVDKRPVKRLRTTLSYIVVAMQGTPEEQETMRLEVNKQHRQVRSAPGDEVKYNAFDRELQLWVAACLYWGTEDVYVKLYGRPEQREIDAFYRHGARFGTTLQVTEDMWPADRDAFEKYWQEGLGKVEFDDVTRAYLLDLARLAFLPAPVRLALGPLHFFMTVGFLPEAYREKLGVSWTRKQQARFDRYVRVSALANKAMPRPLREFPWNVYLVDVRRRVRKGRAIV
ncbi:DUF2236 domain-containing protein [Actinomadura barringtoniae]|uniref:DUF2236 domain-containing protein n=1 Tax=Actinomadura barringtoniae TaxID=1427535 RepID=A0A939PSJ1_9ACTN|nr:oxygenase MpaB family protein [Actinomadura barringtoniae]MBO2453976.1 DUF2236 domain-containing protein [Actinomadura barringtoniae]